MEIHLETLPPASEDVLPRIARLPFIADFYLAGGTGLALQLGHRISGDFDFFSEKSFEETALIKELAAADKKFRLEKRAPQTAVGIFHGVKTAFFEYPYPLLKPLRDIEGLQTADILDIACMKIDAIASRGAKRDFIDLYVITRHIPLDEVLSAFQEKFSALHYNLMHVKKGLAYFEDAEDEPLPRLLTPVSWSEVKKFFQDEVKKLI